MSCKLYTSSMANNSWYQDPAAAVASALHHPSLSPSPGSSRNDETNGGASMRRSLLAIACEERTLKVKEGQIDLGEVLRSRRFDGEMCGREKLADHDGACGGCAKGSVATAYGRRPGRLLKRLRQSYLVLTSVLHQVPAVLSSDRHVFATVNCRSSARGNLHQDLDLAAPRPAVLARAQPPLRILGSCRCSALSVYSGLDTQQIAFWRSSLSTESIKRQITHLAPQRRAPRSAERPAAAQRLGRSYEVSRRHGHDST
eukprot:4501354-Pleurochrysis_carterae.AAC.1